MSGQARGLEMALDEFEQGWVYCRKGCGGKTRAGHCPTCGSETSSRELRNLILGGPKAGPKELPQQLLNGGGELWREWQVALGVVGSLDTSEGGGKAYSLLEQKEARRIVKLQGVRGGPKEVVFSLIDGLLIGHAKGSRDGQKHVIDNPPKRNPARPR